MPADAIMRDASMVERKLQQLRQAGKDKLHVVADFDMTLTAHGGADPNIRNSSWGVFESEQLGPKWFVQEYKDLFTRYNPVSNDPILSAEEKDRLLHEWYEKSLELVVRRKMTRRDFEEAARSTIIVPRPGLQELFFFAQDAEIPFIVFSAGIGNFIEEYFRYHGVLSDNVRIISNFYTYDVSEIVNGAGATIHSLNKNEAHAAYDVHRIAASRRNVLLLGDFEHDIHMADGEKHNTVLSVGFLNGRNERLDRFKEIFDIVVPEDGNLDVPLSILKRVCPTES